MTTSTKLNSMMMTIPHYGGLYLYNQLKDLLISRIKDKFIVINYVTEQEAAVGKMGHWVVLDDRIIAKGEKLYDGLYFFDSYGLKPDMPRDIMKLPNTHEISKLIDRLSNNYKYNRFKNSAMIMLQPLRFQYNTFDFQAWIQGDDTCGVYSFIYAENPNFLTNPVLNENDTNRALVDEKLQATAIKAGVIITRNI
jgi:hypothetical protein